MELAGITFLRIPMRGVPDYTLAGQSDDDQVISFNLVFLNKNADRFDIASLGHQSNPAMGLDLLPDQIGGKVIDTVVIPDEGFGLIRFRDEYW